MKLFLEISLCCFLLLTAFFSLGGYLLIYNFWAMLIILSIILAAVINAFLSLYERVRTLEARVKELEEGGKAGPAA